MAERADARVVRVSVDDMSVVLAEDVHDWLRIVGEVDELKVRYDASCQRPFYWVRFRNSWAAKLAVDHLDGERLKNHIVKICSSVYTKQVAVAGGTVTTEEEACREAKEQAADPNLPMNHLMPPELRMDALLVRVIPDAVASGSDELVQRLRGLQESYCRTQESLERARAEISRLDQQVAAILQGSRASTSHDGNDDFVSTDHTALGAGVDGVSCLRIRNTVPVPLSVCEPAGLILKVTRHIGPVVDYAFSFAHDGLAFDAVIELFHVDDAILALRVLTGTRVEKSARVSNEGVGALVSLVGFGWEADTSVGPLRLPHTPVESLRAHRKAGAILSKCRRAA